VIPASTPDARDADIPRHLSHHLAVAHTVHAIIGMSLLALSRLPWPSLPPLSRELPICRFTSRAILLVIPIDAPALLSFELSPHLHDGFLAPLQDPMPRILATSPWRIPTVRSNCKLKQALIPRSPVQLHASFQHLLEHFQHNLSVQSFDEFKGLSLLSFATSNPSGRTPCTHPLRQIFNHD
jgi:hypothetical protein